MLPATGEIGVHAATSVGPVVTVRHVLPGSGGTAGIGPDAGVPGVGARATHVPVGTGVQTAVAVSHDWSCDVFSRIWIVVFMSGVGNSVATLVAMSTMPIVPASVMPASGSQNQTLPSGPRVSGPGLNDISPAA